MPAALDVDREQVRMLVLAVGVREAARQMGLGESVVMQWSAKGKWLAHTRPSAPVLPASMQSRDVSGISKPGDALQKVLTERHGHTKLGLSLYAARASRVASKLPKKELLEHAPTVKAIADVMSKVWPEVAVDQSTHLSFFSVAMERPGNGEERAIEMPDITSDPLEEY